jgi:hypothetical protein
VKTIVRTRPIRRARRTAASNDAACRIPTAKKITPSVAGEVPHSRVNQKAMYAWTTNPPPNESSAKSPDSRATTARERSSGREPPVRGEPSSACDRPVETTSAISATTGYSRSSRCGCTSSSSTAPAARAPMEPASVATMLYVPNRRVAEPWVVNGSMACSSDVNGPDSTTSVETVPVSAATTNQNTDPVSANTAPERPITTRSVR